MYMGDVFAIFGTLLAVGIALPGLLLAWSLLFPALVARSGARLAATPWRCLAAGLAGLLLLLPPGVLLLGQAAGPAQLLGWAGIALLLTGASLGAAGLAGLMGARLHGAGAEWTPGNLLRGAIALELAAAFPLIGWFVVMPIGAICALGAALLALLRRKAPAAQPTPITAPLPNV